jgi:hypothetical protein
MPQEKTKNTDCGVKLHRSATAAAVATIIAAATGADVCYY